MPIDYPRNPGRDICGKYKKTGRCPAFDPGGKGKCAFDHPPEVLQLKAAGLSVDQAAPPARISSKTASSPADAAQARAKEMELKQSTSHQIADARSREDQKERDLHHSRANDGGGTQQLDLSQGDRSASRTAQGAGLNQRADEATDTRMRGGVGPSSSDSSRNQSTAAGAPTTHHQDLPSGTADQQHQQDSASQSAAAPGRNPASSDRAARQRDDSARDTAMQRRREEAEKRARAREQQQRAQLQEAKQSKQKVEEDEKHRRKDMMVRERKALEDVEAQKQQQAAERRAKREADKKLHEDAERTRELAEQRVKGEARAEAAAQKEAEAAKRLLNEQQLQNSLKEAESHRQQHATQTALAQAAAFSQASAAQEAADFAADQQMSQVRNEKAQVRDQTSPAAAFNPAREAEKLATAEALRMGGKENRSSVPVGAGMRTDPRDRTDFGGTTYSFGRVVPVEAKLPLQMVQSGSGKRQERVQKNLWRAIEEADLCALRAAIKDGAILQQGSPTLMGMSALHLAAHCGHTAVVKCLLHERADLELTDLNDATPLHFACRTGQSDIVGLLTQSRASLEPTDSFGRVPLHLAASNGSQGGVYAAMSLIKARASCNLGDKFSQTPLHFACQQQLQFTAQYMVDHGGADPKLVDLLGQRPGDLLKGGMPAWLGEPASPKKKRQSESTVETRHEEAQSEELPDGFSGGWGNSQLHEVMFDKENPDPSPGPAGYSGLEQEMMADDQGSCAQQ